MTHRRKGGKRPHLSALRGAGVGWRGKGRSVNSKKRKEARTT